jgi:hypothetical protein
MMILLMMGLYWCTNQALILKTSIDEFIFEVEVDDTETENRTLSTVHASSQLNKP